MGTSSSTPSPNTPEWRLARSILGNQSWDAGRQSQEIWRAVRAQRRDALVDDLSSDLVFQAGEIARGSDRPADAVRAFDEAVHGQYASGLTLDIARRALMRATGEGTGFAGFASELFAETAGYMASRDLSSYVGPGQRVKTAHEAITVKRALVDIARQAASDSLKEGGRSWRQYVEGVVDVLTSSSQ